jgi:glycosyltransferase involved in cell wall biosynthesis/tetratricopeptide (TPR) repeat protein
MLASPKSSDGAHPAGEETAMRHFVVASRGHILRAASVVAPHNLWLIKRRSKWLRSRGDAAGALALLDRALILAPAHDRLVRERVRVIGELADRRWAARDAEGAYTLVDQLLTVASQDQRVIRERANICARFAKRRQAVGDNAGALRLIDQALAVMPRNEQLLRARAYAVVRLVNERRAGGDTTLALTLIDEALLHLPDDPTLLASRAATLHALGRFQEACDAWRLFARRAPLDVRGWAGMARALHMLDRAELIGPLIAEYSCALEGTPDRYVRAARVAMTGRRTTTFQALLTQARTDAVGDPIRMHAVAELLVGAGNVGEALNCLDEALKLDRRDKTIQAKRQATLNSLRIVGVSAEFIPPPQRAELRMPDLALLALLRRAPSTARKTTNKIAMVYTTLGPGGAERQLANTVRGLLCLESPVEIVLMPARDEGPETDRFHVGALDALRVPIDPCNSGRIDGSLLRGALGHDAEELFALLPRNLRQQIGGLTSRFLSSPPAVAHAWGDHRSITTGIAAALAGVPRIVLGTRTIAPSGSRAVPTYFHTIYKKLLDHPSVALVNNSTAGARTYAEWLGVDATRVGVIYNGVDIDGLQRARNPCTTAAHRARLGLPAGAMVVGSVFRLGRVKRPLLWLEAAAEVARRCAEAYFVIVGEGPLRATIETAAAELGIDSRLRMPGLTRDVAPWYDLMDVVLLTSEREGTSNTVLEAQALGKPVVAPAVGGMSETFVPGTTGFLVSADPAPEEIAECVMRALTDGTWRNEAEDTACAFIRERFSIERMVSDTMDLYGLQSVSACPIRHPAED